MENMQHAHANVVQMWFGMGGAGWVDGGWVCWCVLCVVDYNNGHNC